MKYLILLINLVISVSFLQPVSAQQFHLVKDLNTSKSSNPDPQSAGNMPFNYYLTNLSFPLLNGAAYFAANDGIHGQELWLSDGTASGTRLVKDIFNGQLSCNPNNMTVCNNKIFFQGTDSTGAGLWVTNGTDAGTKLIKSNSDAYMFTAIGKNLYFVLGNQLWISDGTAAGTLMIIDIGVKFSASFNRLFNVKGKLYFSAKSYDQSQQISLDRLYVTDGSETGTVVVSNTALEPLELTEGPGGLIYFTAHKKYDYNNSLYVTTGQPDAAGPAVGSNDVYVSKNTPVIKINNTLYFAGFPASGINGLYKYDMNAATGISQVLNLNLNKNSGISMLAAASGNRLFFETNIYVEPGGYYKKQLWVSDGSEAGTLLLKDSTRAHGMADIGGLLYFSGTDSIHGEELWKSDGTVAGTVLVKDIYAGKLSSKAGNGSSFAAVANKILFGATTDAGSELWSTDGTATGTVMLKDINQTGTSSSYPSYITPAGSKLFFAGYDGDGDILKWWGSDGSTAGTVQAGNIIPDALNGALRVPVIDGKAFLFGQDASSGKKGLFISDGTANGTKMIFNIDTAGEIAQWQINAGNLIYFVTFKPSSATYSLWRSNGSGQGTYRVSTGAADLPYTPLAIPAGADNIFYFIRQDNGKPPALFKTDGTATGTMQVKDIYPGRNPYISDLTALNGKLYFIAEDAAGKGLWQSDGTDAGTVKIAGNYTNPYLPKVAAGRLLFMADTVGKGQELWCIDSSSTYSYLVKDINPGAPSSNLRSFVASGGKLFFFANDGVTGTALWKSDGTKSGTLPVKLFAPGNEYIRLPDTRFRYNEALSAGGKLYMLLYNRLWVSNGTDTGTHKVNDSGLADITTFGNLAADGNRLWFPGYTYKYGQEIYLGEITPEPIPRYTFTGNGAFNDVANWLEGQVPPQDILNGIEVLIKPTAGGTCLFNKPLHIKGGKLTITPGAKVTVAGNLIVQ